MHWTPLFVALLTQTGPTHAGEVRVPLSQIEAARLALSLAREAPLPDVAWGVVSRRLEGRFDKGLLRAVLTTELEVLGKRGHQRIPIIDARASLGGVELDGHRTSLLAEAGLYTVGIDSPGRHRLKVEVYFGREQDRYARRLQLRLPPVGSTQIELTVPEQDIDARLVHGALVESTSVGAGTRLRGHVDAEGILDLSWARRLSHQQKTKARTEAQLSSVVTVREEMVEGLALFDITVAEGEIDRVDLALPAGLEVTGVEGDAVLQWRTEVGPRGQLAVLLRYLVEDHVRVGVRFQFPVESGKPIELVLPSTLADTALVGAVGIRAPAGLDVKVDEVTNAEVLTARDIPAELSELSPSPLIHAFRFRAAPHARLSVTRHAEVELTSTIVDEIQASTVLIETGLEITKLKLRVRNNTRQHLTMWLPEGSVLTHSLVDGQPVRPAISGEREVEALLLPLRQSQRIRAHDLRVHQVREGETLSDIANFYYSDPSAWERILAGNADQLGDAGDVAVGQSLRIPTRGGSTVEESSFVLELAYERPQPSLGRFGLSSVQLPRIDVDTVAVTWHVYLPRGLEPLVFWGNLTQYSALRYDPFRRLRDFLDQALMVSDAWAGAAYKSILSQRRVIWEAESDQKAESTAVLSSFPLVGDRYRFKRLLLGEETPSLQFIYMAKGGEKAFRMAAFLVALGLGLFAFRRPRGAQALLLLTAAMALFLFFGHFVLGVHRRLLWGFDLALLATLALGQHGAITRRLKELSQAPFTQELITVKNALWLTVVLIAVLLIAGYPLLLSTTLFFVLLALHLRRARRLAREVSHG